MEPMIRADKRHGRRYISEGARGAGVHLATNTPSNSTSDQQYALGGAANALGGAAHEHDTAKTADGVEEQLHQTSAACRASDYRKTGTLRQEGVRSDDTTDLTASRANGASHTEAKDDTNGDLARLGDDPDRARAPKCRRRECGDYR